MYPYEGHQPEGYFATEDLANKAWANIKKRRLSVKDLRIHEEELVTE